jgi:hypothetical protein
MPHGAGIFTYIYSNIPYREHLGKTNMGGFASNNAEIW